MKLVITPRAPLEEEKKKKRKSPAPEEEMEEELERPAFQPINRQKSAFDQGALNRAEGINTAPSVFDRTCLFRTGERR